MSYRYSEILITRTIKHFKQKYDLDISPETAGRLGIEPRLKASKASVLPLDDLPIFKTYTRTGIKNNNTLSAINLHLYKIH